MRPVVLKIVLGISFTMAIAVMELPAQQLNIPHVNNPSTLKQLAPQGGRSSPQGQGPLVPILDQDGMAPGELPLPPVDPSDIQPPIVQEMDWVETSWLEGLRIGYDGGFVFAAQHATDLQTGKFPFKLQFNGWGQLRHATFGPTDPNDTEDLAFNGNQIQLKRGRLIFSGSAFTPDFFYFVQLEGRSSSGDDLRLLDYYMSFDLGRHFAGWQAGKFGFKAGKYKVPFDLARYLSARGFEFTDRSMASMFFDANRSLAVGLYGRIDGLHRPLFWEAALFNGLVTGGAETGSSGKLDNNFAYSARAYHYPVGNWGNSEMADFEYHHRLATRVGCGFANSTINRLGQDEFARVRVVDSGKKLQEVLDSQHPSPHRVMQYTVNMWSADVSAKYRGWSLTNEYYWRLIDDFEGAAVPNLVDYGLWLQLGKFVIPGKLQLMSRWSVVFGNSGTLGLADQSSREVAGGGVWYFNGEAAKLTFDFSYLNSAPISSESLDIFPADTGWLFRTQIQFAF